MINITGDLQFVSYTDNVLKNYSVKNIKLNQEKIYYDDNFKCFSINNENIMKRNYEDEFDFSEKILKRALKEIKKNLKEDFKNVKVLKEIDKCIFKYLKQEDVLYFDGGYRDDEDVSGNEIGCYTMYPPEELALKLFIDFEADVKSIAITVKELNNKGYSNKDLKSFYCFDEESNICELIDMLRFNVESLKSFVNDEDCYLIDNIAVKNIKIVHSEVDYL